MVHDRKFPIRASVIDLHIQQKWTPRIEIFMLELVYTVHFMLFGQSGRELRRFENLVFPKNLTIIQQCLFLILPRVNFPTTIPTVSGIQKILASHQPPRVQHCLQLRKERALSQTSHLIPSCPTLTSLNHGWRCLDLLHLLVKLRYTMVYDYVTIEISSRSEMLCQLITVVHEPHEHYRIKKYYN